MYRALGELTVRVFTRLPQLNNKFNVLYCSTLFVLSRITDMVRVFEGKIIIENEQQGNENCFELE